MPRVLHGAGGLKLSNTRLLRLYARLLRLYARRGSAGSGQRLIVILDVEAVVVQRVLFVVEAQLRVGIAPFFIFIMVDGALLFRAAEIAASQPALARSIRLVGRFGIAHNSLLVQIR